MLEDGLQLVVEQLAERLGRSVIVDDPALRPLAVSAQLGQVDQSRIDAVLQRRTSDPIRAMITEHGLSQARGPVRIPANAELGTLPRLAIPLVDKGYHVGYLWLIDNPALTEEQVGEAVTCAAEVGGLLGERLAQETEETESTRRLVDDLLRPDAGVRERAAERMRDVLDGTAPYVVGVVRAPGDLRRLAGDVRRRAGRRTVVCGSARTELVLITRESRRDLVVRALRSAAPGSVIGLRGGVGSLGLVRDAGADARYAAEVAEAVTTFDGLADWADLGPYAAFQHLARTADGLERLCPGVSALWDGSHEMYESTIRAYLDHGANAQKTATALHIHRTTLYWRLANAERLLGLDLARGDDRLRLHMALTFADLVSIRHLSHGAAPDPDDRPSRHATPSA
ncbi:CdaR family transcriptional regulator [Amycolatopsis sp. MtRt-6]|uniref:PucR family transcriptional regulator n=1 Tax=Amycolatopsis sp. MtRt-6 TaxID=2792782 RepID=UPI001A8C2E62|nr:helix-turn-helix domain-containing protein [Amycolatopsis sp. MtRt-6]